MKKVTVYSLLLSAALLLLSCGKGGNAAKSDKMQLKIENISSDRLANVASFEQALHETPSQVAVALFNALTDGDRFVVESNIHFPDTLEGETFLAYYDMALKSDDYRDRTTGYRADYRAVSETLTAGGDSAYVELVGRTALGEETRFTVLLVDVEGWWKVDGPYSVLHRTID